MKTELTGRNGRGRIWLLLCFFLMFLSACGTDVNGGAEVEEAMEPPEIEGLVYLRRSENRFANRFFLHDYEDGFSVLSVVGDQDYLLVPKEKEVPPALPGNMTVIRVPAERVYLAGTAMMSFMDELGALDAISFSSLEEKDWYIENAARAVREGKINYAGKYREPDYEMLLSGGCELALENTMILHTPEVKEKLLELGIPVFIDHASYEEHPMGRVEWVKACGALVGRREEAEAFFAGQEKRFDELMAMIGSEEGDRDDGGKEGGKDTGRKTVAFFYMNQAGAAVVRRTEDYIPRMISMAGGSYVFSDLKGPEESHSGSITMSFEEFYKTAGDADILIYNATIDRPLSSVKELTEMNPLFAECRAVKEGQVYTTTRSMYQETAAVTEILTELARIFRQEGTEEQGYFVKVE